MKNLMLHNRLMLFGISAVSGLLIMDTAQAGILLNSQTLTGHNPVRKRLQDKTLMIQKTKGMPDNGTSFTGHILKDLGHQGTSLTGQNMTLATTRTKGKPRNSQSLTGYSLKDLGTQGTSLTNQEPQRSTESPIKGIRLQGSSLHGQVSKALTVNTSDLVGQTIRDDQLPTPMKKETIK